MDVDANKIKQSNYETVLLELTALAKQQRFEHMSIAKPPGLGGASNVFQGAPSMSSTLLASLNTLQTLSHTLFLSLSPAQTKPPPPPSVAAFLECNAHLADTVDLARKHQIKQREIDALEAEILDLDTRWREIIAELVQGKQELEAAIEEGDQRLKAIAEAKKGIIIVNHNVEEALTFFNSLNSLPRATCLCPEP